MKCPGGEGEGHTFAQGDWTCSPSTLRNRKHDCAVGISQAKACMDFTRRHHPQRHVLHIAQHSEAEAETDAHGHAGHGASRVVKKHAKKQSTMHHSHGAQA